MATLLACGILVIGGDCAGCSTVSWDGISYPQDFLLAIFALIYCPIITGHQTVVVVIVCVVGVVVAVVVVTVRSFIQSNHSAAVAVAKHELPTVTPRTITTTSNNFNIRAVLA